MTESLEIPACAAIRWPEGLIVAAKRHDRCIIAARLAGLEPKRAEQGFMTTLGRFVSREEAMLLAIKADLPSRYSKDGKLHGKILFSEDLY